MQKTRTLAGRFELADIVGRGAMGTVYRATDLVLRRPVAVKLLAGSLLEDPRSVARFEREARAAASLAHPGVVAVYDTGVDDGSHFIVMELVRGRSLAAMIGHDGPLDADSAVAIAGAVADALGAAHAAGLVHRDVKPGNVMVGDDGVVKVLDFGIARALEQTALTQTASVVGTAAYMAPEQALGDPADARSDIYSLGCLLHALLLGRPPFVGPGAPAVTHQHVHVDPAPLRQSNPLIPAALDALVLEMLSKSPDDRPQTAADIRDRLARIPTAGAVDPTTRPAGAFDPTTRAGAVDPTRRVARGEATHVRVPRVPSPGPVTAIRSPPASPSHTKATRGRGRLTAAAAGLALLAGLAVAYAVTAGDAGRHSPPAATTRSGAARTTTAGAAASTAHGATTAGSASTPTQPATSPTVPATTAPTQTTPAPGANAVAGAAAGLTTLVAQAARIGAISPEAATQLTSGLSAIAGAADAGASNNAQQALTDLTRRVQALESSGQISAIIAAPLNAALGGLSTALGAGGPTVSGSPGQQTGRFSNGRAQNPARGRPGGGG
ncbi:MAG TPA: protein kinase [Solirubrobacteraceae bacterium]|nr:protein kinase [Solirubrobacteraceae bacterium]